MKIDIKMGFTDKNTLGTAQAREIIMAEPIGYGAKTLRDITQLAEDAWGYMTKKKKRKKSQAGDIELSGNGLLSAEKKRVQVRKRYEKELGYK